MNISTKEELTHLPQNPKQNPEQQKTYSWVETEKYKSYICFLTHVSFCLNFVLSYYLIVPFLGLFSKFLDFTF